MKRYEILKIEITEGVDVVSTSSDVTTEGIRFPWSDKEEGVASAYRLLRMNFPEARENSFYEM